MNKSKEIVIIWGTFDKKTKRIRVIQESFEELKDQYRVIFCHIGIWGNNQICNFAIINKLFLLIKLPFAYLILICKYLFTPKHNKVIVCCPAIFDLPVLFLFAKLKGAKIYWDIFISLYDTEVNDRKSIKCNSIKAKTLYLLEFCCTRLADVMFIDTYAHAKYFEQIYNLPEKTVQRIWVGVTNDFNSYTYSQKNNLSSNNLFSILFYGSYIPLQGITYIIKAFAILENDGIAYHAQLIGSGQTRENINNLVKTLNVKNVKFVDWLPFEQLPEEINHSDISLGIFGTSKKAYSVIPNKVYEALALGSCIITGDTPGIHELLKEFDNIENLNLVQPGNPQALADMIKKIIKNKSYMHTFPSTVIDSSLIAPQLKNILSIKFS